MAIISKEVITVKPLLEMPLVIPDYQRPYKWQARHVNQLFNDMMDHRDKGRYRLGTVVLNTDNPESKTEVVDGQQRLLTLSLLCKLLNPQQDVCQPKLLESTFSSTVSQHNLWQNHELLNERLEPMSAGDRASLLTFILTQCECVTVTLANLSEAFQFFDSQNARGKALEPYDLLKAFHLREFSEEEKVCLPQCVANWEQAATTSSRRSSSQLAAIMSDHLFRLRRWADGESGFEFSRHQIDSFKGVNLSAHNYPMSDGYRATEFALNSYNNDPARQWDQQRRSYPFQVNQTMINGRRFFDYIQHYINLYQTLFVIDGGSPELRDILKIITSYNGANRIGDHYVRILFECALLFYYDKFGDKELGLAARLCFRWSYRIRLQYHRVAMTTIDNKAMASASLIRTISRAVHPADVLARPVRRLKQGELKAAPEQIKETGLLKEIGPREIGNE